MGLFKEVKDKVTVRQAAEYYGLRANRSGMIRCICHEDKNPSMKVDRRYYCFGCGCTGDVIDFVSNLFGLNLFEAAKKLADDFGISDRAPYDQPPYVKSDVPIRDRKLSLPDKMAQLVYEENYKRCLLAYTDYLRMLDDWRKEYPPKSPDEAFDPRFVCAMQELTIVEYKVDILLFGTEEEQRAMVAELMKGVKEVEQTCRRYFNKRGKRSIQADDQHGEPGKGEGCERISAEIA